jgi:hypothetical protein
MNILENLHSLIPNYETTLPFSKEKISFTPFRVKDAKALSVILQEDNKKLAFKNMIDLLKTYASGTNIDDLCLADAEYLFLQIRSKSVDEILNLIYNNEKIQVNIAEIKPRNEVTEEHINLSGMILVLQTPTVKDLLRVPSFDKEDVAKTCIQKIIVGNEIYKVNKFVTEEIKQLIENLPLSIVGKLDSFLKRQPELYLNLSVMEGTKEVSGLLNFFTYR